jgi:hypothetical protein
MDASPGGVVIFVFLWATNYTHARRNHDALPCCTHCCCYWQDTHYTETGNMDKGGGTHTHTAVSDGGGSGERLVGLGFIADDVVVVVSVGC